MYMKSHLDELEAEAVYIIREVAAECERPVMLYSIGKDSSVMLHLAMKAFYPVEMRIHGWDPKNQRPEMWKLYNTWICSGESMRVFPLSNWTEKDIWQYILREQIDIVPLYFAKERPVVFRNGNWIMADDERLKLKAGEEILQKKVRFRTLGCYPLTGAIESEADTLEKIVKETMGEVTSERTSRVIDYEETGSMERRKREGYF
ncbi:MAG: sulfate adenylyltransferase subunit CysD [Eubacterium sp.]|nr:sulfate adenylyltransferase subunit CysD [Eubacterium sp.]